MCAKDMVGSGKKRFGFRYRRVISFIKVIPKRKIFFKPFIEKIKIFFVKGRAESRLRDLKNNSED